VSFIGTLEANWRRIVAAIAIMLGVPLLGIVFGIVSVALRYDLTPISWPMVNMPRPAMD
jgi:hypothetical protein